MESGFLGRSPVALLPAHAAAVPQDDTLTTALAVKSHLKMGGVARMNTPSIRVPHPNSRYRQPVLPAHRRLLVTATARSDSGQAVKDARPTDVLEQQVNGNRVGSSVLDFGFLNDKSVNGSANGTSVFLSDTQAAESGIQAADQRPANHTNGAAKSTGTNGAVKERPSELGLGIAEFLKGKKILLTGATGFLAKVLVEKILREQPDVGHLYLIIQPRSDVSPEQRLANQVVGSQIFSELRLQHGDEFADFVAAKLTAVEGTISKDGLGMSADVAARLADTLDVIVNSAATTTFDERYDLALNVNMLGPQRILSFASQCKNLQLLLHVSTAFVNGSRVGRTAERPFALGQSLVAERMSLVEPAVAAATACAAARAEGAQGAVTPESFGLPASVPVLDPEGELGVAEREREAAEAGAKARGLRADEVAGAVQEHMVTLGTTRAQLFGWQDTYVFTKAMGEMLLGHGVAALHRQAAQEGRPCSLRLAIVRPSIVESAMAEPFPGWMEGMRMADPILLAYGKGQMAGFLADPDGVIDVIPVDFVNNAILAVAARTTALPPSPDVTVYHVATSVTNPLNTAFLASATSDHFEEEPMKERDGRPVRVARMKAFRFPLMFWLDVWVKYLLPLQLARLFPSGRGTEQKRVTLLLKTAEQLAYLAKIYAPYTYYACRFDTSNTEQLFEQLSEEERQRFNFDIRSIDWHRYIAKVHLPGLRKFVLKGRGS